ncbi:hypothetical protein EJ04DRAFT_553080 [Polyplosphaeria fusca]|uniref:F-box domain-containing protein n=1 Tax=Polyplosphaeria fusca TaxID=682080 RepID=A0A9P4QZ75_9PLEO|nr:hypothetical protein EJ04DRAFT_553080 [Polyplosphaeria fusca]
MTEPDDNPTDLIASANPMTTDNVHGRVRNPRPAKRRQWRVSRFAEKPRRALPYRDCAEYRHNITSSQLHSLPGELILDIGDILTADAVLAMRLVCRDFYFILRPPLIADYEARESFKAGLKRDAFSWYPRYTQLKGLQDLVICAACRTLHAKSRFTSKSLSRAPEERTCIGAEQRLRLCNHRTLSLNDIREHANEGSDRFDCLAPAACRTFVSITDPGPGNSPVKKPFLEAIIAHVEWPGRIQIARHFQLFTLAETGETETDYFYDERIGEFLDMLDPSGDMHLQRVYPWRDNADDYDELWDLKSAGNFIGHELCARCPMVENRDWPIDPTEMDANFLRLRVLDWKAGVDVMSLVTLGQKCCPEDIGDAAWPEVLMGEWIEQQNNFNAAHGVRMPARAWQAQGMEPWEEFEAPESMDIDDT